MVKPCPVKRAPCYLLACAQGCKAKREAKREAAALTVVEKPRGFFCHIQQTCCWSPICVIEKKCALRKEDNVNKEPKVLINGKPYRICQNAPDDKYNLCTNLDCVDQDDCVWGGKQLTTPEYGLADVGHVCPHDKADCKMMSCNGGANCFSQRLRAKDNTSGATYAAGSYQGQVYKDCHKGMNRIGFINKAEIMVGRRTSAENWREEEDGPLGLIIGLLGDPYPQKALIGVNDTARTIGAEVLTVLRPKVPNIWIEWPDYGIVPFDRAWWDNLVAVISRVEGSVLIYCMGGHGRTGTAAAIIGCLGGFIPAGVCPVEWLREKYCDKVVESEGQLSYIANITGWQVTAKPPKTPAVSTHYAPRSHHAPQSHQKKKRWGSRLWQWASGQDKEDED